MIRFDGPITGAAEKRFWRHGAILASKLFIVSFSIVTLPFIIHGLKTQNWLMFGLCLGALAISPFIAFLPQDKKYKQSMIPRRIVIDDDTISAHSNRQCETRTIGDVKTVYDYGEFYMMIFPFGKVSSSFICQKDLLTQCALEDFEKLFDGKIVVVNNQ